MKEVTIEDILYTIDKWKIEASSSHNDGWIVEHYAQKIEKLQEAVNRIKKPKLVT
jgi:hypothetical protein